MWWMHIAAVYRITFDVKKLHNFFSVLQKLSLKTLLNFYFGNYRVMGCCKEMYTLPQVSPQCHGSMSQPRNRHWHNPQSLFKFHQLYTDSCMRVCACVCNSAISHEQPCVTTTIIKISNVPSPQDSCVTTPLQLHHLYIPPPEIQFYSLVIVLNHGANLVCLCFCS